MAHSSPFTTSLSGMVVPVKAASVYAAHESSLFLSGQLIPQIAVPAGSITAQVPFLAAASAATTINAYNDGEDITSQTLLATPKSITASIYAARTILRDLGAIDPAEIGRVLGNAVAKKFDKAVMAAFGTGSTNYATPTDDLTMDLLFDVAAAIRNTGDSTPLYAIVSPAQAATLLKDIAGTSFAGGQYQTEALMNGFVTKAAGITIFQSSYANATDFGEALAYGVVFSQDAMRVAMFKNVDVEVQRRAESVGNDIVASLHAGVGQVDADRIKVLTATA
jgi:hypothetical protein